VATKDITPEVIRELLAYDPETGIFTRRVKRNKWPVGSVTGRAHNCGYFQIDVLGKRFLAHRLAWAYVHGVWPTHQIDHINGNRSDNRISNLREATPEENGANRTTLDSRNTSGVRGVYWARRDKRWRAQICLSGKRMYLGNYHSKADAAAAYNAAAIKLFGKFYNPTDNQ
jgi:hypothetical protein